MVNKWFLVVFLFLGMFFSMPNVKADELVNGYNYSYRVEGPLSVFIIQTGETYVFDSVKDRDEFISYLEDLYNKTNRSYSCYPGVAGYPLCQKDPIVSVSTTTGRNLSTSPFIFLKYLNSYWYKGPVNLKADSWELSATMSVSYKGVSGSVKFSASQNYTGYKVPKGKSGRLALYGRVSTVETTIKARHRSGKVSTIKGRKLVGSTAEVRLLLR